MMKTKTWREETGVGSKCLIQTSAPPQAMTEAPSPHNVESRMRIRTLTTLFCAAIFVSQLAACHAARQSQAHASSESLAPATGHPTLRRGIQPVGAMASVGERFQMTFDDEFDGNAIN